MKTFEQLVNEATEEKPYKLYTNGYIYFNSEDTVVRVDKTGRVKDIIGAVSSKKLPAFFPNGQKLVFALLGRYLQYLFPNDKEARTLSDRQYVSWFVVEKNKITPKFFKLARGQGWLQPATIGLDFDWKNIDKETKEDWEGIIDKL